MEMKGFTSPSPSSCKVLMAAIVALLVLISSTMKNCSATTTKSSEINFIHSSCASILYPNLCYSSLSPYASSVGTNSTRLAIVALKLSLSATRNSSALVTMLSRRVGLMSNETANIKDCVVEVGDATDQLKQSLEEMNHLGGPNFEFNKNSIQTWVSAAMTDHQTCLDGLDRLNGLVEKQIKNSVTTASRLISNALAIINSLTSNSN
ncbi:pectinesterase inhibitor 10-like [Macadamia integrifolia]|uniref:pectinesterase inhibitor 10-like n=1 Tax=Macadamia integrifolia TaxID=60698 RepID=UPI001C4FC0F5|nr:pectinesterase inhibitor 10-like [Macadamia integrifolia]